ncbi:MAG: hypothetical protein OIN66_16305 [Candidatus Methanoperedens sp.]|nr:hypothetical protein [Candidatus Methanoperedens sp.]
MNTEATPHEKGVNIIKLPSIEDILNNLRYLLSGLVLALSALGIVNLIRQNMLNKDLIILIIVFLSGWTLAMTPFKNIIQPYKHMENVKLQPLKILLHGILTGFWIFGLVMGLIFSVFIIYLFIK